MAKRGIDISAHQGNIDLAALKNQIDFVIIRVGYGTNGTIDTKFRRNADLCVQLGIPFGFYWYSYALNVEGARREAMAFLNAIEPYKNKYSYGCWFDMEDADHYKERNGMPSNQTLREMCAMFCKIVEESDYYVGVYASASWFNNQLNGPELKPYDKWTAQWPTSGGKQKGLSTSPDSRSSSMWQFTSVGRFSGYNGNLDTNYAYYDYPQLIRGISSNTPSPEPTPVQPKLSNTEMAKKIMYEPNYGGYGCGEERFNKLRSEGYDPQAVQDEINRLSGVSSAPKKDTSISKGDKVRMNGSKDYNGNSLASWVKGSTFDVIEVSGDRVVIGKGNAVTAAVKKSDLTKV